MQILAMCQLFSVVHTLGLASNLRGMFVALWVPPVQPRTYFRIMGSDLKPTWRDLCNHANSVPSSQLLEPAVTEFCVSSSRCCSFGTTCTCPLSHLWYQQMRFMTLYPSSACPIDHHKAFGAELCGTVVCRRVDSSFSLFFLNTVRKEFSSLSQETFLLMDWGISLLWLETGGDGDFPPCKGTGRCREFQGNVSLPLFAPGQGGEGDDKDQRGKVWAGSDRNFSAMMCASHWLQREWLAWIYDRSQTLTTLPDLYYDSRTDRQPNFTSWKTD